MMCLHMICWIDFTNHLVPMVTPLGRAHTHTFTNTGYTFTQKQRYQPNKYFSCILFFIFFSKTCCIFKRLLVRVCSVRVIYVCVRACLCMSACTSVFPRPKFCSLVHEYPCSRFVCTQVCVCGAAGSPLICA